MGYMFFMGLVAMAAAAALRRDGESWPTALGGGMLWGALATVAVLALVGAMKGLSGG